MSSGFTTQDLSLILSSLPDPKWRSGLISNVSTMFRRHMLRDRCKVCNNLRSDCHENAVNVSAGFLDHDDNHTSRADAVRVNAVAEAGSLLQLEGIAMKEILKCRIKNDDKKKKGAFLSDCRFCRFICDIVDQVFPYHAAVWEARCERGTMRGTVDLFIHPGRPLVLRCRGNNFEVETGNDRYSVDIEVYRDTGSLSATSIEDGSNLEEDLSPTRTRQAEVLPHVGPANPIPSSSDSLESQDFVARQYQHCLAAHPACQPTGPKPVRPTPEGCTFVPTRLLRVTDDRVRVVESETEEHADSEGQIAIPWVALSHCWGGSSIITLKKDSLESMKEVIQWADLPPTFQNAITATRRLGIEHIWIDSLCIVQDDSADWEREAADMGAVYGYATLVVSAASSWGPSVPFLQERDDKWKSKTVYFKPAEGDPVPFQIRRRIVPATRLDQGSNEPPYTSDWATLQRPGPLYRRSWTFQEAFLAVRAVHFNPSGLMFECRTHRVLEGALPPYPSTFENTLGEFTAMQKWRMIIKAYSSRDLTFQTDRLPAIAGIAAVLQQQTGDQYIAGLWASTLISDLTWHAMPGAEYIATAYPFQPYVAPSWSWASIRRGVVWNPYRDFEPLASVLQVETFPKVPDSPFGELQVACLLIRARTLRCRVRWDAKAGEYVASFLKSNGRHSTEQWFLPDGSLVATQQQQPSPPSESGQDSESSSARPLMDIRRVYIGQALGPRDLDTAATFLCIGRTPRLAHDHVGLILGRGARTGGIKEYTPMHRVGAISNLPQAWYDAGEECEVLLF